MTLIIQKPTGAKLNLAKTFAVQNYMWEFPAQYGLWSPANITTALWLDAADASTIAESGGAVSQWNDKSGNGRHAIQATSGNRPTVSTAALNGKNVITFNGSSQWFANFSAFSVQSLIAVAQSNQSKAFAGLHTASSSELILNDAGTGVIAAGAGGSVLVNGVVNTSITFQQPFIWVNNRAAASSVERTLGQEFNAPGSGRAWVGYCAELIDLGATPSTTDRQKLEGYLAHKWGLTANLPSDHPYKTAEPTP
jgi:hypothetical protein